jgi:hypothetical protein
MSDDVAAVSATFKEAMNAVTALREVEKAKKNDEFRTRIALADLAIGMERLEQLWNNGILSKTRKHLSSNEGSRASPQHADPSSHPSSVSSSSAEHQTHSPSSASSGSTAISKPPLTQFAAAVTALHERLEVVVESMTNVLASAAKGEGGPLTALGDHSNGLNSAQEDSPFEQILVAAASSSSNNTASSLFFTAPQSSGMSKRGPPIVTLVGTGDEFSSPSTSACFSPRHRNRFNNISNSDSVSFMPEEAFRPNADDLVSRGVMTQMVMSASTSTQTLQPAAASATLARDAYIQQLEQWCTPEQLAEAKKTAEAHVWAATTLMERRFHSN